MVSFEIPPTGSTESVADDGPRKGTAEPVDGISDVRIVARIDRRVDALSDYLINTHIDALLASRVSDGGGRILARLGVDLTDARIDRLIEERVGDRLDFRIDWRVDSRIAGLAEGLAVGTTDALIDARIDARVASWFEARLGAMIDSRIAARLRRR
jgi:hypothetical protein